MVMIKEELKKIEKSEGKSVVSFRSECEWIESLINFRIRELCDNIGESTLPDLPTLQKGVNPFFDSLIKFEVSILERIALSLAYIAQTMPQYLDYLYTKNKYTDQVFTEFGIEVNQGKPIIPTWKTAFFLFSGNNTDVHFSELPIVYPESKLYENNLLIFPTERPENPFLTPLLLSHELVHKWSYPSEMNRLADKSFPADRITSPLSWSDLFINEETEKALHQFRLWLRYEEEMRSRPELAKHLNRGIRVLFYGPSGTGKTLTASLIGKEFNLPVYRVDLSQMVSKWIGETEKNLARVFDAAERENWVLFFDEADALFSTRGEVSSSNDRHANQQISYLLQRVENYDGAIVMATNLKDNIDSAFLRRFQLMIEFPMPNAAIRAKIWENLLLGAFPLEDDVDFTKIGANYELTGGSMKNIFRSLMLKIYDKPEYERTISMNDIAGTIEQELMKSGVYLIQKKY